MSTTKITIIVLILVALLFVIFMTRGALREDKPSDKEPPSWTKAIKGVSSYPVFRSMQPKLVLEKPDYSNGQVEVLAEPDNKPFRMATFRVVTGNASITYVDRTKNAGKLKEQGCPPWDPGDDDRLCTIVALKGGGTLKFSCLPFNSYCLVHVE